MVSDKIAWEDAAEGVPIVVVYPGVVYGPGKLTICNVVAQLDQSPQNEIFFLKKNFYGKKLLCFVVLASLGPPLCILSE